MFVDSAVTQIKREGAFDQAKLATSVPQTVLEYLEHINPRGPDTPDRLDDKQLRQTARVRGRAAQTSEATLEELRARRRERGGGGGFGTVWTVVERPEISFKKTRARRRAGSA